MITKHQPWAHQQAAYDFVRQHPNGAMLAMDPGTGKTKVAIDLIQNSRARMILIACPKSVIDVWPHEFEKHLVNQTRILPITLGYGSVADRTDIAKRMLGFHEPIAIIGNYEMVWREPFRAWALDQSWDLVIADESHRIKSAGGKASFFFRTLRSRSAYCLALTGTPMPHSPLDLYAQMRFVDPSVFGSSKAAFLERYCFLGGFSGRQIIGWQHLDELHEKFYTAAFRVTDDVLDLPPEVDEFRTTVLEPKAARHYRELRKEFITATERGAITASNALVKMLRLQQLAGGWLKHEDGTYEAISRAKLDLFADTVSDLPPEQPLVVFCRFHRELDALAACCRDRLGRTTSELSGRRQELRSWQRGDTDVLLAQIQAGSEGNDLTRSRYTLYYSQGLSLGNYQQSRKRTSRPGQTHQTTFIHLLVKGTIDEKIYRTFATNGDIIATVLRNGP